MTNPFNPLFEMPVTGAFIAPLAHEIASPLAAINLELLLTGQKNEDFKTKPMSLNGLLIQKTGRVSGSQELQMDNY